MSTVAWVLNYIEIIRVVGKKRLDIIDNRSRESHVYGILLKGIIILF